MSNSAANQPLKLGVIGDPIKHSISPQIHQQFAEQTGIAIDYQKYHVFSDQLESFVRTFFANGGHGLNVTLPHKTAVAKLADIQTETVKITGGANTLYVDNAGQLVAESTDGYGLLSDLKNHQIELRDKNVLLLGAGGAARSVIYDLLKEGANIFLWNRTESKAHDLVEHYKKTFDSQIEVFQQPPAIDLVISSLSDIGVEARYILQSAITQKTNCYDLNYGPRSEMLNAVFHDCGGDRFIDGMGMLIGQAARSFEIWTNTKLDIGKTALNH